MQRRINMKRRANSILAILLAVSAMLTMSCGETSEKIDETSSTPSETEKLYPDDLPADLNFDGKQVKFLYRAEISSEFYADSENGEVVNDAIFRNFRI